MDELLNGTASRLGLDQGQVIARQVTPGAATSCLEIISLWPGARPVALPALSHGISQAGYQLTSRPRQQPYQWSRADMSVRVTVHRPGEKIAGTNTVVPPDTTGFRIVLAVQHSASPGTPPDPAVTPQELQPVPRRRRRLRRAIEWRVYKLLDGTVLGAMVIVVAVIVQAVWWKAHGERRERKRYLALARDLGLDEGQVLARTFTGGGPMNASSLTIIVLRPGPWEQVLREVAANAKAAGYRNRRPHLRYEPSPRGDIRWPAAVFNPPAGQALPTLYATVFLPGETIPPNGTVVPQGYTGLQGRLLRLPRQAGRANSGFVYAASRWLR